jgi:hypothetical protein
LAAELKQRTPRFAAAADAIQDNTGGMPKEVSANNGFYSETNLEGLIERAMRG